MILIMVNLFDSDLGIVFVDIMDYSFEIGADAAVEYFPAVFGRKDDVVVTAPDAMMITVVSAIHAPTLTHGREDDWWTLHLRAYARSILVGIKRKQPQLMCFGG